MKQYNLRFESANPTQQTFYVPPYSQFQMGVRVDKLGVKQSDISVLKGSTLLSSSGTYNDFYVYDVNSGAPGAVAYTVKMLSSEQPFNILQVVTESTVYDKNVGGGGGGGGDFDPTKYYEKSETSSNTQLNTKFGDYYKKTETSSATQLTTKFGGVDLSIATLDTAVQTNTASISEISTVLTGDPEQGNYGLTGTVDNLTGEMSMVQGTVNEIQTDMYTIKPAVLAEDSIGGYQSKVVVDNNCSAYDAGGYTEWSTGVTALQQISQSEYDDLVSQMATDPHVLYIVTNSI